MNDLERARLAVASIIARKERIGRGEEPLSESAWQFAAGMQAGAIEVLRAIENGQTGGTISGGMLGNPMSPAVADALNPPIPPLPDRTGGISGTDGQGWPSGDRLHTGRDQRGIAREVVCQAGQVPFCCAQISTAVVRPDRIEITCNVHGACTYCPAP